MKAIFLFLLILVARAWPVAPSEVISPLQLKSLVRKAVAKELDPRISFEIDTLNVTPPGATDPRFFVLTHPPLGLVQFEVQWSQAGVRQKRYGSTIVRGRAKVAVAKSPLRHQDLLDRSNVEFQERELNSYQQTGYFLDWSDILSHRANGYSRPGTVLGTSHVGPIRLIEPNQMVDLIVQRGNVRIVAKVKALDSGGPSDLIRVQNLSSQKTLQARVSGPGSVEMP